MTSESTVTERIALTLWVGAIWSIGYIAAPVLFKYSPTRMLAGNLAGEMFTAVSYIGIACAFILITGLLFKPAGHRFKQWRLWIILLMLLITLVGQFALSPMMQQLKHTGIAEGTEAARQFGRLHGVASILFLVNSLSGLILVITGLRPKSGS